MLTGLTLVKKSLNVGGVKPFASRNPVKPEFPSVAVAVDGIFVNAEDLGNLGLCEQVGHGLSPRLGLAAIPGALLQELLDLIERLMMGFCLPVEEFPDSQGVPIEKSGYFPDGKILFPHIGPELFF